MANGNVFFIGIDMTVIAFLLRLWLNNRYVVILLTVTWLIGISLVILSATPIHPALYVFWLVLCIATRGKIQTHNRTSILVTSAFVLFSLIICLVELPFHLAKAIPVSKQQTTYVVGDSISAGIGEKEKTWPGVLGDLSQLNIVNLARPGATVETAMFQADEISSTNALVFVEIGGNDLLGKTDSHTFYFQLDELLKKLKDKNAQIAMFELPLLPFWNQFGEDQRTLAKKYGVILIPKKYLVEVFAGKGNTIDGLHLSQKGHDELAKSVSDLLEMNP